MNWLHSVASVAVSLEDWRYLTALAFIFLLGAWRPDARPNRKFCGPSSRPPRSAWELKALRLVGALTRDEQRSRQCLETQRLARSDAKEILGYLRDEDPGRNRSSA